MGLIASFAVNELQMRNLLDRENDSHVNSVENSESQELPQANLFNDLPLEILEEITLKLLDEPRCARQFGCVSKRTDQAFTQSLRTLTSNILRALSQTRFDRGTVENIGEAVVVQRTPIVALAVVKNPSSLYLSRLQLYIHRGVPFDPVCPSLICMGWTTDVPGYFISFQAQANVKQIKHIIVLLTFDDTDPINCSTARIGVFVYFHSFVYSTSTSTEIFELNQLVRSPIMKWLNGSTYHGLLRTILFNKYVQLPHSAVELSFGDTILRTKTERNLKPYLWERLWKACMYIGIPLMHMGSGLSLHMRALGVVIGLFIYALIVHRWYMRTQT